MLVICPFPQGVAAGQRLKYEQYFDEWRSKGWDIDISSFMDEKMWRVVYQRGKTGSKIVGTIRGHLRRLRDLSKIPNYDLVYIFMYVTPLLTNLMERSVRLLAKRVIYDIEDNIHIQQYSRLQTDPNPLIRFLKWPNKIKFLIRSADYVITSSPFLNIDCKRITTTGFCSYVSSSLDTEHYKPKLNYSNDKTIVIGWTGTYSSKKYLDLLKNVLIKLSKKVKFKLHIISNFKYDFPEIDLKVIDWNLETEIKDLQSFDIGLYPLPLDDWVHGKSGLKAIQYMALGIPCVATAIGTTPMLINDRVNGRLVITEEQWIDALEELVLDSNLRQTIGKQARLDTVAKYSLSAIGKTYDKILQNVMERV